jgi:hypothetical protein
MVAGLLVPFLLPSVVLSQDNDSRRALLDLADEIRDARERGRTQLYFDLLNSTEPATRALNEHPDVQLMYVRPDGKPMYYRTANLIAAQTVSTDEVWPGGATGYNLTGAGTTHYQFAVWDGGGVLLTHQEFGGRVIQVDGPIATHYHSTHVAGTMAAAGVNPGAKGMSYQANLNAYDWNSDFIEMASAAAAGLQVSNHSYGYGTGWEYYGDWYWFGDTSVDPTEDYGFGFYDAETAQLDDIAYNAPNYLIVMSAGNDRNDYGPAPGEGHWYWDWGLGQWVWSTVMRDADGGPAGYDCIGWNGNAKNILTVGAVNDIPGGYTGPGDVVQASFSSWGPCDDGRIKPDIVANGIGLLSCHDASNVAYASLNGTSMSSPNAAGSINLLARHFETAKGTTPRSATLKAVVIHSADEAGPNAGPDYMNGWGLLNTAQAADVIAVGNRIIEDELAQGEVDVFYFTTTTTKDVRASLVWTDVPGSPAPVMVDPPNQILVNDLDLRITRLAPSTDYFPWNLDGANPANAATQGDNAVDNLERVDIANAPAGDYMVVVSHKGSITGSVQQYSLVCSEDLGAGDYVTCPDDDVVPAGSTIVPSMVLSGFEIMNASGINRTFSYNLVGSGPCTLVDNGDPASLSGTTPVLLPGESFTPPEAALVFPPIRVGSVQTVTYYVSSSDAPPVSVDCMTTITIHAPVPVVVNAFDAVALPTGVELSWSIAADEAVKGFRVYRSADGDHADVIVNAGGLIPAAATGYTDGSVQNAKTYAYTLAVVLDDGTEEKSQTVTVRTAAGDLTLDQNHPNPFNPSTRISFGLDRDATVSLVIYDVSGRHIRTLVSRSMSAGVYTEVWDGRDAFGQPAAGGIYFYRLSSGTRSLTKKMILLK